MPAVLPITLPSLSESRAAGVLPSPLALGKACFLSGHFQLEPAVGLRKMPSSHRRHDKEGSWHLGTQVKNSVRRNWGFI